MLDYNKILDTKDKAVLSVWGFFMVIYLKVSLETLTGSHYRSEITIISVLLMTIGFLFLVRFAQNIYGRKNQQNLSIILSKLAKANIINCLIMCAIYYVLCRIIVFGFAIKVNQRLDFSGYNETNGYIFLFIVITPIFFHYIISLLDFRLRTQKLFGVFDNMLGGVENAQKIKKIYRSSLVEEKQDKL